MLILSNYSICNGFLMFSLWSPERKASCVSSNQLSTGQHRKMSWRKCPSWPVQWTQAPDSLTKGRDAGFPTQLTLPGPQRGLAYIGRGRQVSVHKKASLSLLWGSLHSCTTAEGEPLLSALIASSTSPSVMLIMLSILILIAFPILIIRVIKVGWGGKKKQTIKEETDSITTALKDHTSNTFSMHRHT